MEIVNKHLSDLTPYENNPRLNDDAVDGVAESIRQFGFKVPMVIDADGVIVCGHTRYKAAKQLGIDTVPCVVADDLTDDQIKAFRLADNKVAETAEWDFGLLDLELEDIEMDMQGFGFEVDTDWFSSRTRNDNDGLEDESEEYQEFVEKFEQKRTTDDCYTPDVVYEAVADFVANKYKKNKAEFVRPFYPGGDYQNEKYPEGCIVVDNPPFSILSEILNFYNDKGIKFFLFAPTLTLFSSSSSSSTAIPVGVGITYENGATVNTSFLTNLEPENIRVISSPELYTAVKAANDENLKEIRKQFPKYEYPDNVVTSTDVAYFSKYGVDYKLTKTESCHIRALDAQREKDKTIFGSGYLVAEKAAAEKAAAEKAAAEKAAAEKAAAEKEDVEVWELSDREKKIIKSLG